MENMTIITRMMYEKATQMQTVQDAARELRETGAFRTLGATLRSFSGSEDPKSMLVDGLMAWDPGIERANIDRKVRNWLGGKTRSVSKQDAFILSRVLDLSLESTDVFLKRIVGEGIHWRDPEDIVWGYAILHGLEPAQIRTLLERVRALGKTPKATASVAPGNYTAEVYQKLQPVLYRSEEELMAFLEAQWAHLGTFHNTAYQLFTQYMQLLEKGYSDADIESEFCEMTYQDRKKKEAEAQDRRDTARKEAAAQGRPFAPDDPDAPKTLQDMDGDVELYQPENLTARDILETYLYRRLVPSSERGNPQNSDPFYAVQRSIRLNWPDEFTLSKMKKRQLDVSRKVLILLFLATDGSGSEFAEKNKTAGLTAEDALYADDSDDAYFGIDEEEDLLTPDEVFQDVYTRLDLMLDSCGFHPLDPRSPFDWLVLFCIGAGDLWETDKRLQDILKAMFPADDDSDPET